MASNRLGLPDRVDALVAGCLPDVVSFRRRVHSYPELAWQETKTGMLCADALDSCDIKTNRGIAETGVVGLIAGVGSGPTIALRADMDALQITEETGLPYQSQSPGVMHACGHDGHLAIVLGTAMVLSRMRNSLKGNVKVIFQPAEEQLSGAERIIDDGALGSPKVDEIYGLHLWPDLPLGHVGLKQGVAMAACDKVSIRFQGRSGHGAVPHLGVDALTAAACSLLALNTVVSREIDANEPAVLSIGRIIGGTAFNTIADKVELHGTVRTVRSSTSDWMEDTIRRKVEGIAHATGARCETEYVRACPVLENDPTMIQEILDTLPTLMPEEHVHMLNAPSMIAEDFACYLQHVPGAMLFLGVGPEFQKHSHEYGCFPLHSSKFAFDEAVLGIGIKLLTLLVLDRLDRRY
ncbi:MAG: M20 family metallopeptidase [Firmicutes bacterium]|nr:M20 family metallopeptidase [Bacillota bacterium]MDD4792624.1 M20 family metallopeptidase [Bacillota bacterium]